MVVTLLPWIAGGLLLLLIVVSLLFNVSGAWERIPSDEEQRALDRNPLKQFPGERIVLGQIGPFVTGRRDILGGYQEFGGFVLLGKVFLTRRDHGVKALVKQGFPEAIARLVDGEITGKLRMTLTAGGLLLDGRFTPQKIEFTHRPPRITARFFLPATPRLYRRLTASEASQPVAVVRPSPEEIAST